MLGSRTLARNQTSVGRLVGRGLMDGWMVRRKVRQHMKTEHITAGKMASVPDARTISAGRNRIQPLLFTYRCNGPSSLFRRPGPGTARSSFPYPFAL